MKKYIIGLMSAICLMGAGCTEFEDYKSADLGEGPAIEVSMDTVASSVGAFTVKIKPAAGTVYYAYLMTTQELSADASTLLQGDYENAVVLNYAEQDSVEFTMTNQKLAQTYYTYAVASNHQGLCGALTVASVFLPDREAPYLINVPTGQNAYKYKATNNGRSIVLEFNETIARGEGAITYTILKADGQTQYDEGTIDDVVINNDRATITLPESAQFDENEIFSYVFLDFAAGAFVDASGNPSSALVGGLDEDGFISAPWWEYKPGEPEPTPGGAIELEMGDEGYGEYYFIYNSMAANGQYGEQVALAPTSMVDPEKTEDEYAIVGLASYAYDEGTQSSYIGANIVDNVFQFNHGYVVGIATISGTAYYLSPIGVVLDGTGSPAEFYDGDFIPFTASAESAKVLGTDVAMVYGCLDQNGSFKGYIDVMTSCTLAPASMVNTQATMMSLKSVVLENIKANRIKAFVENNAKIPYIKMNFLR